MCLEITVSIAPDAKGRISADRLSTLTGLAVSSCKVDGAPALHFAVTGGCSCEFLSDDADFEAESWALAADHLSALARAIKLLSSECKRFSLLAHWLDGERPIRTEAISGAALARLVEENRLGNNVVYLAR